MDISKFLNGINTLIINPLIVLLFAVALLVFFFGIFQFVGSAGDGTKRDLGKKKILYGLIGMFIMFSAYGLIRIILGTFNIQPPEYIKGKL